MKEDANTKFVRNYSKLVRCIDIKGGSCEKCGRDLLEHPWEADFHHINGKSKYLPISQMLGQRMSNILKELAKCRLLCVACHRLLHFDFERFHRFETEIRDRANALDIHKKPIDEDRVYRLVKRGLSSDAIGKKLQVPGRTVRTLIRRLEKSKGEKLMLTKREYLNKHQKITDTEIVTAKKAGTKNMDICEQYSISYSGLASRLSQLRQRGEL